MKPLSEQLADLSAHAKEARDAVQARVDKLQVDASARRAKVDASAAAAKDAVVGRWTSLQTQVKTGIDGIKADVDAKEREADSALLRFTAIVVGGLILIAAFAAWALLREPTLAQVRRSVAPHKE